MTIAPLYDPLDFERLVEPYETYRLLRDEHPVYHNLDRGIYALSRFNDVREASRDWETFSSRPGVDLDNTGEVFGEGHFIDLDPPRHDQLRDVVRRLFSPRAIRSLEEHMAVHADALIDGFIEREEADLATEFAWRIPVAVISQLMGFPERDHQRLVDLGRALVVREPRQLQMPPGAIEAVAQLREYFRTLLAEREREPRGDVLSQLAVAGSTGDVRPGEVLGMCYLLFTAGIETTASLISNTLAILAARPGVAEFLRRTGGVMPRAIEEFLRYESPVQQLARSTTRAVRLHGSEIPPGARVVLIHGSANRDERRFERANELVFDSEVKRTMAFGEGIHFCLGAPLARPEACIAIERFLARISSFEVAGLAVRTPTHSARGWWRLPMRFERMAPQGPRPKRRSRR
jgi:cytochrome P450